MSLPRVALPTKTLDVLGQEFTVRGLSRAEAMRLSTEFEGNPDGAETFVVSCGSGVTAEEAAEWRNTTDITTVGQVVDAIIELSGLMPSKDGKSPQL